MNQENIDYLKNELKNFGFGDKLNQGLENSLKEQPATFQLSHQGEFKNAAGTHNVEFVLNFKKSEKNEKYYFNSYKATLQTENPDFAKSQTFYTQDGLTAKEAFNLLDGRAVNKNITGQENNKFNAWRQLDFETEKNKYGNYEFKQYHENYGYNLEQAVSKFPIKELSNEEDKTKLLKSLQKGNVTEVTFISEGKEQRMFLTTNPRVKAVNVFDENMKSVYTGVAKEKSNNAETKKDTKETVPSSDEEPAPGQKAKRNRVKM